MAKRKIRPSRAARRSGTAADPQVNQTIQDLRDFYQLGQQVVAADKKNPRNKTYSLGVVDEIAKEIGKSRDYVHKARNFAERYTKADLDELCRLRRPDGTPPTPRTVMALLRIKNKRDRKKFQRQAAREGWSTRRVSTEISKLMGSGSSGGRRPKTPKTIDDALIQVLTMTNRWHRWYAGFDPQADNEQEQVNSRIGLDDLPESIRKQLKSSARQIEKLKDAVNKELELVATKAQSKKTH